MRRMATSIPILLFNEEVKMFPHGVTDPARYYLVIQEPLVATSSKRNVLGYIRVLPGELPTYVARRLYSETLCFRLEECDYPEALIQAGVVGFLGGQH